MYLKSIEVHGFKSFANKINFKFHNGITGIVGPNGSGKSNVADAVRWVLGEQRIKQLRGASMQDVIFSGTEARKPLSYAYVAITLDNTDRQLAIDYKEVTIARRIYRSGESEYLLNNTICRLKDVNELFYDTGIGKEGYSIIGQGQIDKILSGKPEERRELFDEAAGIVKFKRRKAAAQKKLEEEKQNLVRVNDILNELEKQMQPLSKQSETAKVYLKKKEELKTLDVNMFLLENKRLIGQLESIEEKYRIAGGELEEARAKYETIKTEYEAVQNEIEQLEASIEAARGQLTDTSVLRGKLEGEINVLKEQVKSAQGNREHLENRLQNIRREMDEKEKDKAGIAADKEEADRQAAKAQKARDKERNLLLLEQSRIEELNDKIESGKNTIIDALNERATIKSKLGRYDTMMEQINIRKAELNSRLLRAKSDEAQQEAAIVQLEEEFAKISEEITASHDRQQTIEGRLSLMHDELAGQDKTLRDMQAAYHQDKSRLEALVNLTQRYEGYGGSVKRVMEQKEAQKGIIGVVADIIKVEKKYELAIETALGANIQNIVTDNEETAKTMIEYLKRTKAGRATFLPLTGITHPQEFKTPAVLEEQGVIGMADALVLTQASYKNVAKAMLGRIVVVDTIDNAVRIARKFSYSIRMVTLEGELLAPGGAISGGAFKNSSSLFGRRREIAELEAKVKAHLHAVDGILEAIEKQKQERNTLRSELENVKAKLQEQFIRQNTARLNVIQARERKEEAGQGFDALKAEADEIDGQIQEIAQNKEGILEELTQSETLEKETEANILIFQKELEERRVNEAKHAAKVSNQDVTVQKMQQVQEFHRQNMERLEGELLRCKKELGEVKEGAAQNAKDIAQKQESITEIEKTIAASYTTQGDTEEKLKNEIARKEKLAADQKTFFNRREETAERMTGLDKEAYRLGAQKEKVEESIAAQINYMWDEYEITLTDAASMRDEQLNDLTLMKRSIAALKDEIRRLGDVNVNAIEDYKNLMERYVFLKTQHDDLVAAEETLAGIIEELDAAMRKQFSEKFREIGKEFDKVFKELFGGGKGTLALMEEEDILEAGIRVIAQPPGKKLQNMMQLSGGEKALTAIALLFAIQNLKPSPFCLLDEIEAALDENNIGRFAKYLHKLTKHTQFIVITHRRGTMEAADRLYGITMQEKGVSALVSVNLIEKDLDDWEADAHE